MSHRRETLLSEVSFSAKALDAIKKAKAKMQATKAEAKPAMAQTQSLLEPDGEDEAANEEEEEIPIPKGRESNGAEALDAIARAEANKVARATNAKTLLTEAQPQSFSSLTAKTKIPTRKRKKFQSQLKKKAWKT
jgi:predicted Zn-dependent protease